MIDPMDQEALRAKFSTDLTSRVRLDLFTQEPTKVFLPGQVECPFCEDAKTLLEEIASLSERIVLSVHEFGDSKKLAEDLRVDHIPAIVIRGKNNRPLRFLGLPTGAQFTGFVETLVDASRGVGKLRPETTRELRKVKNDVDLKILVAPSCTHSPPLVRTAFNVGLQKAGVKVTVIEASEFPDLVQRYVLSAVPTTVINEAVAIRGAMDEETLIEVIQRTVEGKPIENDVKTGPFTPLAAPRPKSAPKPQSHGLIIPR